MSAIAEDLGRSKLLDSIPLPETQFCELPPGPRHPRADITTIPIDSGERDAANVTGNALVVVVRLGSKQIVCDADVFTFRIAASPSMA